MGTEHEKEAWDGVLGAQREENAIQNIYTVLSYSSGNMDKGHESITHGSRNTNASEHEK